MRSLSSKTSKEPEDLKMPKVKIWSLSCVECGDCVVRCPVNVLSIDDNGLFVSDSASCIGCRICEHVCPYGAITVKGSVLNSIPKRPLPYFPDPIEGDMKEVEMGFSSLHDAQIEASRCINCPDPSCVWGCPAHNDIPGFITAIKNGDIKKAGEVLDQTTIFAAICARVCDKEAQCEGTCALNLAGAKPVSIGLLERFVADMQIQPPLERKADICSGDFMHTLTQSNVQSKPQVVVVGGGPAGIAAAYWLLSTGVKVRILERDDRLGGVLSWGMPGYVLPRNLVTSMLKILEQFENLTISLNCTLGKDVRLNELCKNYDAVLLAHGASIPPSLSLYSSHLKGVVDARTFLENSHLPDKATDHLFGQSQADGENLPLLVIGGGDTAMAVCRTARRLGKHPLSIRRSKESDARVRHDELLQAVKEGVSVRFGTRVESLEENNGAIKGVVLAPSSKSFWKLIKDTSYMDVDGMVIATGFKVDNSVGAGILPPLPLHPNRSLDDMPRTSIEASGLSERGPYSTIAKAVLLHERSLEMVTQPLRDNCWVAGDALNGPSSVVEAMAQGREAAKGIISALGVLITAEPV